MKRFGVLLALLVLGSLFVGTGTVQVREVSAASPYYIVVENYTQQMIEDALTNVTWLGSAPNYNVSGNMIYFDSLSDMLRFLSGPKYTDPVLPEQNILTSVPLRKITAKVYDVYESNGTVYYNLTFSANDVYVLGAAYDGDDYGGSTASLSYAGVSWVSVTSNDNTGHYTYFTKSNYSISGTISLYENDKVSYSTHLWVAVDIFLIGQYTSADVKKTITGNSKLLVVNSDVTYQSAVSYVTFHLTDALSGQPLDGVTVKEGNSTLGTLDDGGTLELTRGSHELTFEKSGYWSKTLTVDVQNDTSLSVEMYPSSAAFRLENFPANISIPENTIYTLTFTLSPIQTSATYNTYLSISGLSNIISVEKGGSAISPEGGKYYLGDISGPTQVSIKFKAGAVGTHGFTITLTSNDAIMSNTYTTTKQVVYQVEPLPFSVQMPSEWQVGQNELRISESSGQSYLVTVVLKDSQGNEVWSASHAFNPYEAYTFTPKIPSEGSYTLELQFNGQTAVYSVQVNPAITLKTKILTVQKGSEGTIVLHFKNPSSDVQYYTIKVSGGFLPKAINQSISVAPATEKDVSIAFAVPDKLTYDAYELNVQVLQGNATVFSDKVAVSISEGSGFSLFGGGSSGGKTLYYGLAVLIGLGLFIAAARRR